MSTYDAPLAEVVAAHDAEIRADLDRSRNLHQRKREELVELERQIASLEGLLARSGGRGQSSTSESMTLHEAMVEVLRLAPGNMLRAGDLAAEIDRRGLYRMRDGRAVEAQQIHARVGHYPNLLAKAGTFITLANNV